MGWKKMDLCHGYNKYIRPTDKLGIYEEGLYDNNKYFDPRTEWELVCYSLEEFLALEFDEELYIIGA